uniref:Uncharacterized protein n=1 Tax=Anguilla anguilla TaxID=7936 RepID=A0A0E9VY65_ANGAN
MKKLMIYDCLANKSQLNSGLKSLSALILCN